VGRYLSVAALGLGAGVLLLYLLQLRGGPPLELWHKEVLESEFSLATADRVTSFEAYLRLEDELFSELDARVYSQTAAGPERALARFSAGSLADPRQQRPNWNRSYELPAVEPPGGAVGGVLLLHGMSDSPYSLRAFAEAFHRHGYWVVGLRLPGHGTVPSGLTRVHWRDMAAAVRLSMRHLANRVGSAPVHVVGYSTGAPLALDYVLERGDDPELVAPSSLVLVSPSIGITPMAGLAAWKRRLGLLPGLGRLAWNSIRPEFDPYKYNSFATNAGEQVHRLTRSVASRIESRSASAPLVDLPPILVLLSTVDATVSAEAVIDNLLEHLAPGRAELVLFDINRTSVISTVLVNDPGPLTERLMSNSTLPFGLTLITNEDSDSRAVESRYKPPLASAIETTPLGLEWPGAVISLSHVALQFPPDDPLYGRRDLQPEGALPLGQIGVQGERGLLKFPADWLLRIRHNPFYDYVEERVLDWVGAPVPAPEEAG
jgi:alpha-beta hydrolase superfamily lysophospholipase